LVKKSRRKKRKNKQAKNSAHNRLFLTNKLLGSMSQDRIKELYHATAQGDIPKCASLLDAGINVNASIEV